MTMYDPNATPPAPGGKGGLNFSVLEPLDWVLCIICSCIGLIVGIVYTVQGKAKGIPMIIVSVAAAVVGGIIRTVIALALHR